MNRSFNQILKKINKKKAVVLTASEISKKIKSNQSINLNNIDVVTTGTRGLMSGTYAILSILLNSLPVFKKAKKVYMNDIECFVGPCPNENLNIIDLIIFGTNKSLKNNKYGAGHLFRDLVSKKKINLIIYTNENKKIETIISINEIYFAKLVSTRNAFKNYKAYVNKSNFDLNTIFHPSLFKSNFREATVSGCGEINPLQNDKYLNSIGIGTKVLMNGSEGYIIGLGTRSTIENPNLMIVADMKTMIPEYMGGFNTSMGPECIVSISIPLLNINNSFSKDLLSINSNIPLFISSVDNRKDISKTYYSDVWEQTDEKIKFNAFKCLNCKTCLPSLLCPCNAISKKDNILIFLEDFCFNCGYCTTVCNGSVFSANLGFLKFDYENKKHKVPIVCRQSDILRAKKLELDLKNKIINGNFKLTMYSDRL